MTKANRLGFPPVPTFVIEGTLRSQALKVLEEAAELVEAVKAYVSSEEIRDVLETRAAMMAESADVNQALMNLMAAVHACNESLSDASEKCTIRNIERGRLAIEYVSVEEGRDA